ncbi:MAG: hypothetical protein LW834_01285 [Cyanobium sp. 49614_E6]|nr:hypothetical protein [Cyanobium sp. 49614_E6]
MEDLRRAVIILAKATGWGLAEILGLDLDEFWAWVHSAEMVEDEIAEAMKRT